MNCTDVQEWMPALVAREVSPDIAHAVHEHMDGCAQCREWHEEVLEMVDMWQNTNPVKDLDLVTPVLQRLRAQTDSSRPFVERHNPPSVSVIERESRRRTWWNKSDRMALLHYGVAAIITVALFQLGVFQQLGELASHGAELSNHMDSLIRLISRI